MFSQPMTDAALMERDQIADAAHALRQAYGDQAPAEALTRALVQERTEQRTEAVFWADVYLALTQHA